MLDLKNSVSRQKRFWRVRIILPGICYVLVIGISYAQGTSRLKLEGPGGPFSIAHFDPSVHSEFAPFFPEPDFKRLEPYAFVLTNGSDWPIQVLTIRWTTKNTEGKEHIMDVSTDNFFVTPGPIAAAGAQLLITPTAMLPQAQADVTVGSYSEHRDNRVRVKN